MFLPGARGFDTYLGIPYSDDMGQGARSPCPGVTPQQCGPKIIPSSDYVYTEEDGVHGDGDLGQRNLADLNDNGPGDLTPLVYQTGGVTSTPGATTHTSAYAKNTTVLEQPVDFSKLAPKYSAFVTDFIERSAADPFFLYVWCPSAPHALSSFFNYQHNNHRYMPFSHVHTTAGNQPDKQYASCQFQNKSDRGPFGDAIAEVDWSDLYLLVHTPLCWLGGCACSMKRASARLLSEHRTRLSGPSSNV